MAEYALWKSVSESSVVPVSAGVRAGVTGVVVRGRSSVAASEVDASSSLWLLCFEPADIGRGGSDA